MPGQPKIPLIPRERLGEGSREKYWNVKRTCMERYTYKNSRLPSHSSKGWNGGNGLERLENHNPHTQKPYGANLCRSWSVKSPVEVAFFDVLLLLRQ
jgi:hypothetical protein